jgi:hypothetical protein
MPARLHLGRTPTEARIAKVRQGWKLVYGVGLAGA